VIKVRFIPPSRRFDRANMAHLCKPHLDGIADFLGVNDRRFLPVYEYAEPCKPGAIEFELAGVSK
jgi:crossover junction endodeoxyribonuclease RusA